MAVRKLQGLTGLATRQVNFDENPQASPEERLGNAADPRHANWGEQASPYPWESSLGAGGSHGPYGLENQMLGDPEYLVQPAGNIDENPSDYASKTHGSPWLRGIASGAVPGDGPDDDNRALSAKLHSIGTGASREYLSNKQGIANQQDEWVEYAGVTPGHSEQQSLPQQVITASGGYGTRDRVQSQAPQNRFGFDSAHVHRRVATGSIPGNYMWMRPGGRPLVKTMAGPARPAIGVDSPFFGDDLGFAFDPQGAVLMNTPTEYVPPAQPNIAPPMVESNDSEIYWW